MDLERSSLQAYGDLITATLFVFIITLVAFVINFSANQLRDKSVSQEISDIAAHKTFLIRKLSTALKRMDVDHEAIATEGVIRLSHNQFSFDAGSYELNKRQLRIVNRISRAFAGIIPCYASNRTEESVSLLECTAKQKGQLHGIVIEGHTDNMPLRARTNLRDNLDLSAKRAASVFRKLNENTWLNNLANKHNQKLFSISGYGENRPLFQHKKHVDDPRNRRIDIRVLFEHGYLSVNN